MSVLDSASSPQLQQADDQTDAIYVPGQAHRTHSIPCQPIPSASQRSPTRGNQTCAHPSFLGPSTWSRGPPVCPPAQKAHNSVPVHVATPQPLHNLTSSPPWQMAGLPTRPICRWCLQGDTTDGDHSPVQPHTSRALRSRPPRSDPFLASTVSRPEPHTGPELPGAPSISAFARAVPPPTTAFATPPRPTQNPDPLGGAPGAPALTCSSSAIGTCGRRVAATGARLPRTQPKPGPATLTAPGAGPRPTSGSSDRRGPASAAGARPEVPRAPAPPHFPAPPARPLARCHGDADGRLCRPREARGSLGRLP